MLRAMKNRSLVVKKKMIMAKGHILTEEHYSLKKSLLHSHGSIILVVPKYIISEYVIFQNSMAFSENLNFTE